MTMAMSRRRLLLGSLAAAMTSTATFARANALYGGDDEEYFDPDLLPPPESEIDFPIEPVNKRKIKKRFHRQFVAYEGYEEPGTVVVDPANRFLYHVLNYGEATR